VLNLCRQRVAFKALFATTFFGLALGVNEKASAQIVRVGPMGGFSLRTPMISVDTLPFGAGTRVRGPFAGVDTGAFRYSSPPFYGVPRYEYGVPRYEAYPYYQPPAYGPGAYLQRDYDYGYRADLDDYSSPYDDYLGPDPLAVPSPTLPRRYPEVYTERRSVPPYGVGPYSQTSPYGSALPYGDTSTDPLTPDYSPPSGPPNGFGLNLHDAATRLEQGLSQREDGEVWLDYLRPRDILAVIDAADPSKTTIDLQNLFRNYEGVAGNQELSHVWVIDGFRQTHQGLKEWLDASAPMSVDGSSQSPVQSGAVQSSVTQPRSSGSSSTPELAAPVAPAKRKPKVEPEFEELVPPGDPEPVDDVKEQKAPAKKPNKNSGVQSL
jgi:hypothetical protein